MSIGTMYTNYRESPRPRGCNFRVCGIDSQPWFHLTPTKDSLLQGSDNRVGGVSWDDLGVMKHVELLSGVTAGVEHDGLLSSWVVWQERGDIEDLAVDDDPDVILLRVLGDVIESKDLCARL